jgi:hypothetical protein
MPEEAETSGAERKPKKRTAKKVAGLRARPDLLSNPALSGAANVAARSVLGQGAGVQPVMAATAPAATTEPVSVPAPSTPPDAPDAVAAQSLPPQVEEPPLNGEESSRRAAATETPSGLDGHPTPSESSSTPPVSTPPSEAVPTGLPPSDHAPAPSAGAALEQGAEGVGPGDGTDQQGAEDPTGQQGEAHGADHDGEPGERKPPSDSATGESRGERSASTRSRRRRSASPREGSNVGPAHQALLNSWRSSRVDLKLRRDTWQTHPFRFAADLVTQLSKRVAQDCSSSGKALTAAQYVDAAMGLYLPSTIEEQLELAEEFLLSRETDVGTGKQASHRVSPEVYAVAAPLANDLREAGHARIAVHVYSGALDRFLRDLEAEGPLGK